jgi:hypothetical protein
MDEVDPVGLLAQTQHRPSNGRLGTLGTKNFAIAISALKGRAAHFSTRRWEQTWERLGSPGERHVPSQVPTAPPKARRIQPDFDVQNQQFIRLFSLFPVSDDSPLLS